MGHGRRSRRRTPLIIGHTGRLVILSHALVRGEWSPLLRPINTQLLPCDRVADGTLPISQGRPLSVVTDVRHARRARPPCSPCRRAIYERRCNRD